MRKKKVDVIKKGLVRKKKIKDVDEWLNGKLKEAYGERLFKKWHRERIDEVKGEKYTPHSDIKIIYDRTGSHRLGFQGPPALTEAERQKLYSSALRHLKHSK